MTDTLDTSGAADEPWPRPLFALAVYLSFTGIVALAEMIAVFNGPEFLIDVDVVGLFLAVGLLRLRGSSWTWALLLLSLRALILSVLLSIGAADLGAEPLRAFGVEVLHVPPAAVTAVLLAELGFVLFGVYYLLRRETRDLFFSRSGVNGDGARRDDHPPQHTETPNP